MVFCDWLLSLSMFSRFNHVGTCVNTWLVFRKNDIFQCMDRSGLPRWLTGDARSIPESESAPGGGRGPLQCSSLENPRDRGTWRAPPRRHVSVLDSSVLVYHILFIRSSLDGHLHYFHFCTILNNAAVNICTHMFKCTNVCVQTLYTNVLMWYNYF